MYLSWTILSEIINQRPEDGVVSYASTDLVYPCIRSFPADRSESCASRRLRRNIVNKFAQAPLPLEPHQIPEPHVPRCVVAGFHRHGGAPQLETDKPPCAPNFDGNDSISCWFSPISFSTALRILSGEVMHVSLVQSRFDVKSPNYLHVYID